MLLVEQSTPNKQLSALLKYSCGRKKTAASTMAIIVKSHAHASNLGVKRLHDMDEMSVSKKIKSHKRNKSDVSLKCKSPLTSNSERSPSPTDVSSPYMEKCSLTPPPTSTHFESVDKKQELEHNPDYIALCSTLSLLRSQREDVERNLHNLCRIKRECLEDPMQAITNLKDRSWRSRLPRPIKVLMTPVIQWSKYSLCEQEEHFKNSHCKHCLSYVGDPQTLFKSFKMFEG